MEAVLNASASNQTLDELVLAVEIDEKNDTVAVFVTDPVQATVLLNESVSAQAPVRVIASSAETKPYGNRIKAGEHIRSERITESLQLETSDCTAGPGVYEAMKKKSSNEWIRAEFLLTAGHCGRIGDTVAKSVYPRGTANFNIIGSVRRTAYPEHQHYEEDAAAIRLNGILPPKYIYRASRSPLAIYEAGWVHPGETLCFSGVTSGIVTCGSAVGIRAFPLKTAEQPHHGRELGIRFGALGKEGDSGAPVWDAKTREVVGILGDEFEGASYAAPLLRPHGFPSERAPGVLNALDAPGGGNLFLERAP